jgi:hypothetical protein
MSTQVHTGTVPSAGATPVGRSGNTLGRMTCLTLFTPIRSAWIPLVKLALWLGKYVPMAQKHILQFEFIHFVRWTIVRELPHSGGAEQRTRLNYPYLFFESNFDGPWHHYIDAFAYIIPRDISLLWGRGIDFPGPPPAEPLKAWIGRNSMEGGTYYSAYPQASTRMVKGALSVSKGMERLLGDAEGQSPEEFKAAYERFLTDQQAHL